MHLLWKFKPNRWNVCIVLCRSGGRGICNRRNGAQDVVCCAWCHSYFFWYCIIGLISNFFGKLAIETSYLLSALAFDVLLAASRAYCISNCCRSVWISSNSFQIVTATVFVWFSQNLPHVFYVPVYNKTVEQIFEISILKFLAIF